MQSVYTSFTDIQSKYQSLIKQGCNRALTASERMQIRAELSRLRKIKKLLLT